MSYTKATGYQDSVTIGVEAKKQHFSEESREIRRTNLTANAGDQKRTEMQLAKETPTPRVCDDLRILIQSRNAAVGTGPQRDNVRSITYNYSLTRRKTNSVLATFIFEGAITLRKLEKGSPTLCCMQSAWFPKRNSHHKTDQEREN